MHEYSIATHALPSQTVAALHVRRPEVLETMLCSHWQIHEGTAANVLRARAGEITVRLAADSAH